MPPGKKAWLSLASPPPRQYPRPDGTTGVPVVRVPNQTVWCHGDYHRRL